METETHSLVEDAQNRALTYRLFAALLLNEVTSEFLQAAAKNPPIQTGELGSYFASLSPESVEQARQDAASEFAALLLGMSANPVVAYESVYTSPVALMMQDARDEVRALYKANGVAVSEDKHLPDDHISFELEFMAILCEREAQLLEEGNATALGTCRATQELFLKKHLAKWAFTFCNDLAAKAKQGLYFGLAKALGQFLEFEMEEFQIAH